MSPLTTLRSSEGGLLVFVTFDLPRLSCSINAVTLVYLCDANHQPACYVTSMLSHGTLHGAVPFRGHWVSHPTVAGGGCLVEGLLPEPELGWSCVPNTVSVTSFTAATGSGLCTEHPCDPVCPSEQGMPEQNASARFPWIRYSRELHRPCDWD